jgi:hypothetical protein
MGHGLGMNWLCASSETYDYDYDVDPDLVWGNTMAIKCTSSSNRYHVKARTTMFYGIGTGARRVPSATDIMAIATVGSWSDVSPYRIEFYSTDAVGNLNTAGNWLADTVFTLASAHFCS